MVDSLKKVFQTLKDFDANPKTVKLSLARKRELLFQVLKLSQTITKKELMSLQQQVVEFVFILAKHGCGASLGREMCEMVKYLYTQGGDFTKVQQEFFDPAIAQITNAKTPSLQKLIFIQLTGKLFKAVWTRCPNPPTKDLFEAYTKLKPQQTEKFLRESAYKALKDVIKCNPSNLFQVQPDIIKHLIKASKDEKIQSVRRYMVESLRVLIRFTLNYSTMHAHYDVMFQAATKGFEESDAETQFAWVEACAALLGMRLQESQQQGDIKTGFKAYNQQQKDAQMAAKKKQTSTFLDVPRTLGDCVAMFCALMLQPSSASGVRQANAQVLSLLAEQNLTHLEATDVETILNSLMLTIPAKTLGDSFQQREIVLWTLVNVVSCMQQDQQIALLKLVIQSLERKQLLISVGTMQTLQAFCGRGQTLSTFMSEHHYSVLLRLASEIIFKMEPNVFHTVFTQEKEILNAVNSYLRQPYSSELRYFAVELIKVIGFRAPRWIHNMISVYLSMTSIQNADNQSLTQTPIYGNAIPEKAELRKLLIENNETLKVLATALACLVSSLKHTIKGVPLALVTTALNAAKNQICGNMPLELPPEHAQRLDLNFIKISDSQRQESGWIILAGLLQLGSEWIETQVSLVAKLFKTCFCRSMCEIEHSKIKDAMYQEVLLRELKIKCAALNCVKAFLVQASDDLKQRTNSIIGSYLCNCLEFLSNVEKLFKHFLPIDLEKARNDITFCLARLPPECFKASHSSLLQPLYDRIFDNPDNPNETPSLAGRLLANQETLPWPKDGRVMKGKHKSTTKKRSEQLTQVLAASQLTQISWLQETILKLPKPSSQTNASQVKWHAPEGLNSSIYLLTNIFFAQDPQSRNKLLSHLQLQYENEKDKKNIPKLIRICTALFYLVLFETQLTQKTGSVAEYNLQHALQKQNGLANEQQSKIHEILGGLLTIDDDNLIRLASHTYVYLLAPKIIKHPKAILPQIINELETLIGGTGKEKEEQPSQRIAKKRAAVVFSIVVRLFDSEKIIGDCRERIVKIFLRLLKEADHGLRKFTVQYACAAGIEGFFQDDDEDIAVYFSHVFPSIFHLVQTDIQPNFRDFSTLAKLINAQMKFYEPDSARSPPSPLRVFLSSNKRMQTIIHELVEMFFMQPSSTTEVLIEAVLMVKTAIVAGLDIAETKKSELMTRCLELLRNRHLGISAKMRLVEALAAGLYKGYFAENPKIAVGLQNILLDELNMATLENTLLGGEECAKVDFEGVFSNNNEFEALINYDGTNNLDAIDGHRQELPGVRASIYRRGLKVLLLTVFKMNPANGSSFRNAFTNLMNLTRSVINYKHQTLTQQQELGIKVDNSRVLIDDPSAFFYTRQLSEDVVHFVAKAFKSFVTLFATVQPGNGEDGEVTESDVRQQMSNLISLTFTIISQESNRLKQVGLKFVIVLVKLYSQACEKVGDDDDDDDRARVRDAQKRRINTYLASPLLLEQYEAQIFSIIRTHLQKQTSGRMIPPNITAINYDLIYLFITSPICKDQSSIKKIIDMLVENMKTTQIVGTEMHSYEAAITDVHFKKLMLLSKLAIVSQRDGEAAVNRLNELTDDFDQANTSDRVHPRHSRDSTLPSKFTSEDQDRLAELIFKPENLKMISNHLICGLSDALIAQLGKKGNTRKYTFITSVGGQGSAFTPTIVAQSVPFSIIALSHIASKQGGVTLTDQETMVVRASFLNNLIYAHTSAQSMGKTEILRYASHKLHYLNFTEELLSRAPHLIAGNPAELSELFTILGKLPSLGIFEINEAILRISLQAIQRNITDADFVQKTIRIVAQMIFSLYPELLESAQGEDKQIFSGFNEQPSDQQDAPRDCDRDKAHQLLQMCGKILGFVTIQLAANSGTQLSYLVNTIVHPIALNIDKVPEESKQILTLIADTLLKCIQRAKLADSLVNSLTTKLGCKVMLQVTHKNQISKETEQIFASLVQVAQGDSLQLRCCLQILADSQCKNAAQLLSTFKAFITTPTPDIQHEAIGQIFQLAHDILIKVPDDGAILQALETFETVYSQTLDTNQRVALLPLYLALLFTVMQTKQLTQQTRQRGAEGIVAIFRVDQQAFKTYAAPNPLTNQSNLTQPEKTLIENVIKQFAAITNQPKTQATTAAPVIQPKQLSQPTDQPVQANKIKLGFNFKPNK